MGCNTVSGRADRSEATPDAAREDAAVEVPNKIANEVTRPPHAKRIAVSRAEVDPTKGRHVVARWSLARAGRDDRLVVAGVAKSADATESRIEAKSLMRDKEQSVFQRAHHKSCEQRKKRREAKSRREGKKDPPACHEATPNPKKNIATDVMTISPENKVAWGEIANGAA
ncbi:hypothetical protein H6P81_016071 [Aristolochia fimbriata]|uniref:Uncharacterized protein n=1 Tax=Aristolochia fimbriata TaxID=158543 RepID=A0AAV7EA59_ARIFI|nr:hypothetical protein H6P81_016071 [Aristolochia fimbriata]